MNINFLCPGNIVSLAYNPEVMTMVTMVEFGGAIQVNCNNYTDDIRDITVIPLNKETLERFRIPMEITGNSAEIIINVENDKVYVSGSIFCKVIPVQYLHQLQNLVLFFTGIAIIDDRKFRV